MYLPY